MNKPTLKQCLDIIDRIEIQGLSATQLQVELVKRKENGQVSLEESEIEEFIQTLVNHQFIKQFGSICDLSIPLTIFTRSPHHSIAETLGYIESLMTQEPFYQFFIAHHHLAFTYQQLDSLFQPFPCLLDSIFSIYFLEKQGSNYVIASELSEILAALFLEKQQETRYLVSPISIAYFIQATTRLEEVSFKNKSATMQRYFSLPAILKAIPYLGIPENRNISEGLQSFFKDCLFHEFEHRCVLCGIALPSMLIASHIKPFRDCGHLIESTDGNNGILLCRNHDYLFDQGYLAFHPNGSLAIARSIEKEDYTKYQIATNIQLKKKLQTPMRLQFLAYHYANYFKGN